MPIIHTETTSTDVAIDTATFQIPIYPKTPRGGYFYFKATTDPGVTNTINFKLHTVTENGDELEWCRFGNYEIDDKQEWGFVIYPANLGTFGGIAPIAVDAHLELCLPPRQAMFKIARPVGTTALTWTLHVEWIG